MNTEDTAWVNWNTFYVGPHMAYQLRPVSLLELIKQQEEDQVALEQEAEKHSEDCGWWQDWHACSCGAFDTTSSNP